MPDHSKPGVYVEETSVRPRSIDGVGTTTAAFVGPTRKGPVGGGKGAAEPPELLTGFRDFEAIYGGFADLELSCGARPNYLAHAVRGFFAEGGSRLYVSRVVVPESTAGDGGAAVAEVALPAGTGEVSFRARFPGAAGNGRITAVEVLTPATAATLAAAPDGSLLRSGETANGTMAFHRKRGEEWIVEPAPSGAGDATPADPATPAEPATPVDPSVVADPATPADPPVAVDPATLAGAGAAIVTLEVIAEDGDGATTVFDDLGFHPDHPRGVMHVLATQPATRAEHLAHAFAIEVGPAVGARALHHALFHGAEGGDGDRRRVWPLAGGSDGPEPTAASYADALWEISRLEDVATVAAPGSSAWSGNTPVDVMNALITHCEAPGAYRMAVLDTPPDRTPEQVRTLRGRLDSRHAALYYPWVVVTDPEARRECGGDVGEIGLPPSGFVCGIYARSDAQRGVHKAPANEIVRSAARFEFEVTREEQELLNPAGVNCLRHLPGRGFRVWGARLISSDPEWKYVPVRRYFNYLEASVDRGTQWVVFEPNDEPLWSKVRLAVGDFLTNEWRRGALQGSSPKEAFFVRCDRSTMTRNDLDNGRLVCQVGVAMVRPAEFVIFRIGQKTADAGT